MLDLTSYPWSPPPVATRQSRSAWALEIGGFRIAFTRTREVRAAAGPGPSARVARPFALGALTGVGAVALAVVGANAAGGPPPAPRAMVSVAVPAAAVQPALTPVAASKPSARRALRRPSPVAPEPTMDGFAAADAPYLARAMATGAFQEWEDSDGLKRFLTVGPARVEGGRACRDLALLIRTFDGGSRVHSAERCTTAPVEEAAPAEETAEPSPE